MSPTTLDMLNGKNNLINSLQKEFILWLRLENKYLKRKTYHYVRMSGMPAIDYLKIPPPPPSIQSTPVNSPPPPQLSSNDQMKMLTMKYKITKNFAEMFQPSTIGYPFRNMLILQFMCVLIDKYKNDQDQPILIRLHSIMDAAIRSSPVSVSLMDECIYLCNNPRVIEAIFLFTN